MGLIYEATNLINHKRYIGQTSKSFEERQGQHLYDAFKRQSHAHFMFYRAIRKYGIHNFQWRIIGNCKTKKQLDTAEKACIEFYQSNNPIYGYNSTPGGNGGAIRNGMKASIKTRNKMSKSACNRNITPKYREAARKSMLGKKLSEETKRKMSEARRGQKRSEESKERMRLAQQLRRSKEKE